MAALPTTTETAVKAKSKADMAGEFGVSVKTLGRWLAKWNTRLLETLQEPVDDSGQYFTPRDVRRMREQFA